MILYSYHSESNQWLDFTVEADRAKILGLSVTFLTAARLAVPLRLGVALACVPFIEENITKKFIKKSDSDSGNDSNSVKNV